MVRPALEALTFEISFRRGMDLEPEVTTSAEPVQSVVENVETVEVVTGEEGVIDSTAPSHGLMEQHMIVTNPQELIVPTAEVSCAALRGGSAAILKVQKYCVTGLSLRCFECLQKMKCDFFLQVKTSIETSHRVQELFR